MTGQHGRPVAVGVRHAQPTARVGRGRGSEGLIVPLKPGNAGGGKEPWFWVRVRQRRVREIGMRLITPPAIPDAATQAVRQGQDRADLPVLSSVRQGLSGPTSWPTHMRSPKRTAGHRAWTGRRSSRLSRRDVRTGWPGFGKSCARVGIGPRRFGGCTYRSPAASGSAPWGF